MKEYLPECPGFICEKQLKDSIVRRVYYGYYNNKPAIAKVVTNESEEALREAENILCVRSLGLDAPEVYYHTDRCIIMEYIQNADQFQRTKSHYERAIQYLEKLHNLTSSTNRCRKIPNLYCGDALRERLQKERENLYKVGDKLGNNFKKYSCVFEKILEILLPGVNTLECVVGHGDFKPDNILILQDRIVPIDWIDFGLTVREYELGALFFGEQNLDLMMELTEEYLKSMRKPYGAGQVKEFLRNALSIAFIIMTGSHFRLISQGESPSEHIHQIEDNVNYIIDILKELDYDIHCQEY